MRWKIEAPSIVVLNVSKNVLSKKKVLEMGIPLYKNQGFPKLSPCYFTN